jgi:VanZ family protein
MAFISFASSDNFSATNTSRIIGPLVLWLFPHTSAETLEVIHLVIRKIAHFSEYGVLAVLAARAFLGSPHSFLSQWWFLVSWILVASYALIDEYHQSFVPSRSPSIYDSLIDVIGGSAVLLFLWARARRKRSSN